MLWVTRVVPDGAMLGLSILWAMIGCRHRRRAADESPGVPTYQPLAAENDESALDAGPQLALGTMDENGMSRRLEIAFTAGHWARKKLQGRATVPPTPRPRPVQAPPGMQWYVVVAPRRGTSRAWSEVAPIVCNEHGLTKEAVFHRFETEAEATVYWIAATHSGWPAPKLSSLEPSARPPPSGTPPTGSPPPAR